MYNLYCKLFTDLMLVEKSPVPVKSLFFKEINTFIQQDIYATKHL